RPGGPVGLRARVTRAVLAAAAWAALLALTHHAAAEEPDKARAQKLFEEGRKAVQARDCGKAVPLFEESYALYATNGTLYNLAQWEEKTGRLAQALAHYKELVAELPPRDARLAAAKKRIAALEPRVPTLQIELPAGGGAAPEVLLDGDKVPADTL